MTGPDQDRNVERESTPLEEELQELRRMLTEDLVNLRSRLASLEERLDEISTLNEPPAADVREARKARRGDKVRAQKRFAAARKKAAASSTATKAAAARPGKGKRKPPPEKRSRPKKSPRTR